MVNFNSAVGNHITQELTRAYAKRTLSSIKAQFFLSQYFKDILEITYMLGLCFTLYHYIIDVHLNILAQLRLKHSGHHSLVGRPYVFQSKGHYLVVVFPGGCKESGLFLII